MDSKWYSGSTFWELRSGIKWRKILLTGMMGTGSHYEWYVKWLAPMESWDCCCLVRTLIFILIVHLLRLQHMERGRERRSREHMHSLYTYIVRNILIICPDIQDGKEKSLRTKIHNLSARFIGFNSHKCFPHLLLHFYLIIQKMYISLTPKQVK